MDPVQVWFVVGIPTLVVGLALFLRRSPVRALLGYAVLAVGFAVVSVYHRPSGAVFGGLLALLYAAGRGGAMERRNPHSDEEGVPNAALHPFRRRPGGAESAESAEIEANS
ncbi:MAG: hypothetical protein ACRDYA_17910 [Egibacteraceae bacterium]